MAGMVCMKSKMGLMIDDARRELAAQIPSGMLMATATTVAITTNASVSIALDHWFTPTMTAKLTAVPTPSFQPLAHQAMAANTTMTAQ